MSESTSFVGIDVSKNVLDVHVLPGGEHWQVSNDEVGRAGLVERLKPLGETVLVVCSAPSYAHGIVDPVAPIATVPDDLMLLFWLSAVTALRSVTMPTDAPAPPTPPIPSAPEICKTLMSSWALTVTSPAGTDSSEDGLAAFVV